MKPENFTLYQWPPSWWRTNCTIHLTVLDIFAVHMHISCAVLAWQCTIVLRNARFSHLLHVFGIIARHLQNSLKLFCCTALPSLCINTWILWQKKVAEVLKKGDTDSDSAEQSFVIFFIHENLLAILEEKECKESRKCIKKIWRFKVEKPCKIIDKRSLNKKDY